MDFSYLFKRIPSRIDRAKGPFNKDSAKSLALHASMAYLSKNQHWDRCIQWYRDPCDLEFVDVRGTQVYCTITPAIKQIVVAFRGSNEVKDIYTNLKLSEAPIPEQFNVEGIVHSGMLDGVLEVWNPLKGIIKSLPDYQIWVTGHSLGGAKAAIAGSFLHALGHKVCIYTYGAPKVGGPLYTRHTYQLDCYRIANEYDPIPKLPFWPFGYYPAGRCHYLLKDGNLTDTLRGWRYWLNTGVSALETLFMLSQGALRHHCMNEYINRLMSANQTQAHCSTELEGMGLDGSPERK